MTATSAIWQQFESTKLRWKDQKEKARLNYPVYVITGCNPHGKATSPCHNKLYHGLLHAHLYCNFPEAIITEVTGQSPAGDWEEVSWAVSGPTLEEAALVAKLFRQLAFFKLDGCSVEVVDTSKCKTV